MLKTFTQKILNFTSLCKYTLLWYKQLRLTYPIGTSILCAPYNARHYNLDGTYRLYGETIYETLRRNTNDRK